jgi:Flp pilus assembly protein TadG
MEIVLMRELHGMGPPARPAFRTGPRRTWGRESGQSLVEFALVVPLLLLLVVGIAEFGRAWMTRNAMTGAAREAVRIAAVQGDQAAALARANSVLSAAGITGATVTQADDNAVFGTCSITVSYEFPLVVTGFLPGLAGTTLPMTSSTSMRKEF